MAAVKPEQDRADTAAASADQGGRRIASSPIRAAVMTIQNGTATAARISHAVA